MSKSTRVHTRRNLERSIGNIEWAQSKVSVNSDAYAEGAPEISAALIVVYELLEEAKNLTKKILEEI